MNKILLGQSYFFEDLPWMPYRGYPFEVSSGLHIPFHTSLPKAICLDEPMACQERLGLPCFFFHGGIR